MSAKSVAATARLDRRAISGGDALIDLIVAIDGKEFRVDLGQALPRKRLAAFALQVGDR
jgi:hypothetical protein